VKYLASWIGMSFAIILGLGSINWLSYRRLAADGVATKAAVIELLPQEHQFVRYEYRAGGHVLQGRSTVWPPNPPFQELVVGESLVMHYDPSNPTNAVLGDPRAALHNETSSIALGAVFLPTFVIAVWAWRTRRGKSRQVGVAA
jgi:hypothetical protein